jgi:DNA primase
MRTVFRGGQKQAYSETYSEEQVRRVLLSCGIDIHSEIEFDYIIYCPYHSNYRTPASEVSKVTGQFYCFGCQERKTLTELVMHTSGRTYFEASRLIKSKQLEENIELYIDKALEKQEEFQEFDNQLIERLHQSAMSSRRAAEYFLSRGITKESAVKYRLGYSESQDMVTVPVASPEGVWLGFVARSVEGKSFKNTPGLPKSKTLFNLYRNRFQDKIFVTESSFDAIRLEQAGVHAVATLGASISSYQKSLLKKYFRSIILIADNDEAGRAMANKLQSQLESVIIAHVPEPYKDVSDMKDDQISSFVAQFDDEISYILNNTK